MGGVLCGLLCRVSTVRGDITFVLRYAIRARSIPRTLPLSHTEITITLLHINRIYIECPEYTCRHQQLSNKTIACPHKKTNMHTHTAYLKPPHVEQVEITNYSPGTLLPPPPPPNTRRDDGNSKTALRVSPTYPPTHGFKYQNPSIRLGSTQLNSRSKLPSAEPAGQATFRSLSSPSLQSNRSNGHHSFS